jgi:hypothetical protein
MRFVIVAVLVMIAGCQETVHCPQNMFGRNCDQALVVRDGGPDTGMDAASEDANVDANVDAFVDPCDSCTADQYCYAGGADSGRERGCVACLTTDGCESAGTDGGVPGAFVCVDYTCVFGCETDVDCAGRACRPNHQCSEYRREQDVCQPCDTDVNCLDPDARCVTFDNGGHPGSYCLKNTSGVPCTERRRFTSETALVDSVDGAEPAEYCVPSAAVTCEAVLSADAACTASAMCGIVDGTGTGICTGPTYCTYLCGGDNDCPLPWTCDGGSSTCTRP